MSDANVNRRAYITPNNPRLQADNGIDNQTKTQSEAKAEWDAAPPFPIAANTGKLKTAVFTALNCKTQLEAALVYAEDGVPVIACNWKPEKLPDGSFQLKKYPLIPGGVYGATTDTKQITEWWTRWPQALIGVPGGRRTGLWFVDADSLKGHGIDGLAAWFNDIDRDGTAKTRAHKSGTEGLHFAYKWNTDRPIGCPKICPGIDVKGEGGYVIFPPSPYEFNGETLRYDISDDCDPEFAPEWLLDRILGQQSKPKSNGSPGGRFEWSPGFGEKKLKEVCEIVRKAQKGEWDAARRKVFMFGRWVGGGAYDVDKASEELERAAKDCNAPEDYPGEVKRAFFNGVNQPTSPFIESAPLADFCAYLPQHSYIYIPTRELWPASSVNARIPSVDDKLKASTWLDKNRCVEQMTWAPGEEMLIPNRLISEGGWIQRNGVTCFNLYRPPTIEPGDASKAGPWIEHVQKVFGNDAEHIIKWCAQRKQHPEIKINHALVLGSEKQGIGKDAMLEPVKRTVGPWNFGEVGPQQLLGRFNGFLKNVILRVNEARDLGDINRYQFYEHTKALTAAPPDSLRVDEKHLQEHNILNCVGIILTTNYKTNGIYLPAEDRRHYVAWSSLAPEDFPDGYWNRLWGWYDAGGDRHVAAYLAGVDLVGFDPKVPPPKTQTFWDIVDANRAPEDSELADVLDALGNPRAVTLADVMRQARDMRNFWFVDWLLDRKYRRLIPHRFEKCGYVPVRNPNRQDCLWKIRGQRQVVYAMSILSLREQLEAAGSCCEE